MASSTIFEVARVVICLFESDYMTTDHLQITQNKRRMLIKHAREMQSKIHGFRGGKRDSKGDNARMFAR